MNDHPDHSSEVRELADALRRADQVYGRTPLSQGGPYGWQSMNPPREEAIARSLVAAGWTKEAR